MYWWGTVVDALSDGSGKPVDWWFIYKLPRGPRRRKAQEGGSRGGSRSGPRGGSAAASGGLEYLYYEGGDKSGLHISANRLDAKKSALSRTVTAILGQRPEPGGDAGWILYNTEPPSRRASTGAERHADCHSKGVLWFDRRANQGLWLVHSVPKYPRPEQPSLPRKELERAQLFFCVTLKNYAAANRIARHMLLSQQPTVYARHLPASVPMNSEIYALANGGLGEAASHPSTYSFRSRGGKKFYTAAKASGWRGDFWRDLVAPKLKADIAVEGWRKGVRKRSDKPNLDLDLVGGRQRWGYESDPLQWALSTMPGWVCIGDMGRDRGRVKMSGGAVCFDEPRLWLGLRSIEDVSGG